MDTRFLTTFLEVVNTRHFGKAAENLYLTQSAVSARIKLLEEYFHTPLFIRQRNSIQLTQAGERLIPYATQLCLLLKEARNELSAAASEYLVIGSNQLANDLLMSRLLRHYHRQFPEWSVKAEVHSLDGLSRHLHERSIDIAVSTELLKSEEVNNVVLIESDLFLYQAKGEKSEISEDFISIDWGGRVNDALLIQFPQCKDSKLRTNSLRLALTTLSEDGGFAVLPEGSENVFGEVGLTPLAKIENVRLRLYLHAMNVVKRANVKQAIAHISSNTFSLAANE